MSNEQDMIPKREVYFLIFFLMIMIVNLSFQAIRMNSLYMKNMDKMKTLTIKVLEDDKKLRKYDFQLIAENAFLRANIPHKKTYVVPDNIPSRNNDAFNKAVDEFTAE